MTDNEAAEADNKAAALDGWKQDSSSLSQEAHTLLRQASAILPAPRIHKLLLPFDAPTEEAFRAVYEAEHNRGALFYCICGVCYAVLRYARLLFDQPLPPDTESGDWFHTYQLALVAFMFPVSLLYALWTGVCAQPPAWWPKRPRHAGFLPLAAGVALASEIFCVTILFREEVEAEWALIAGQLVCSFPFGLGLLIGTPFWICTAMQILGFVTCAVSPHTSGEHALSAKAVKTFRLLTVGFAAVAVCALGVFQLMWILLTYNCLRSRREMFLLQLRMIALKTEAMATSVRAKSQQQLVAATAHDLKTPLSAIQSGCRVLAASETLKSNSSDKHVRFLIRT